jgi:hypothetical protein
MRKRLSLNIAIILTAALTWLQARAAGSLAFEFPFEYREGLLWLKVSVQESGKPLNMLLDSGANVSVINLVTARRLGLEIGQPVRVEGVNATTTGYWPQHLSASARTAPLPRDFLAVDLSDLSDGSECAVDGLLGADFFADHVVRIDFSKRRILFDPSARPTGHQFEIPLRANLGALQIPVNVNGGGRQWVRLDTGCNSALHWVGAKIQPGETTPQVAVALTKMCLPVTQMKVQIGQCVFDNVPAALHPTEIFAGEAGLLGNGLLSRFSAVTIDLPSNRVLLEKYAGQQLVGIRR